MTMTPMPRPAGARPDVAMETLKAALATKREAARAARDQVVVGRAKLDSWTQNAETLRLECGELVRALAALGVENA